MPNSGVGDNSEGADPLAPSDLENARVGFRLVDRAKVEMSGAGFIGYRVGVRGPRESFLMSQTGRPCRWN